MTRKHSLSHTSISLKPSIFFIDPYHICIIVYLHVSHIEDNECFKQSIKSNYRSKSIMHKPKNKRTSKHINLFDIMNTILRNGKDQSQHHIDQRKIDPKDLSTIRTTAKGLDRKSIPNHLKQSSIKTIQSKDTWGTKYIEGSNHIKVHQFTINGNFNDKTMCCICCHNVGKSMGKL